MSLFILILYLNNPPKNSTIATILFCIAGGIMIFDLCICLCIPDIAKEAICKKNDLILQYKSPTIEDIPTQKHATHPNITSPSL
jgi:hypothetical protein